MRRQTSGHYSGNKDFADYIGCDIGATVKDFDTFQVHFVTGKSTYKSTICLPRLKMKEHLTFRSSTIQLNG